jgi:hypothetical protein
VAKTKTARPRAVSVRRIFRLLAGLRLYGARPKDPASAKRWSELCREVDLLLGCGTKD